MTTIPGGEYLGLRLRGDVPAVYGRIAEAFEVLFDHAERDSTGPQIESYRLEGEVDCFVPIYV